MTRSLLRPIRTRRIAPVSVPAYDTSANIPTMTPGTRKTLAAIGALWVSFATSAAVSSPASAPSESGPGAIEDPAPVAADEYSDDLAPAADLTSGRE